MEPFDHGPPLHRRFALQPPQRGRSASLPEHVRVRTPKVYRICDRVTEIFILFLLVFTPWAFGTTQNWSIWTMNIAGYILGAMLLAKWIVRWKTQYIPSRWGAGD